MCFKPRYLWKTIYEGEEMDAALSQVSKEKDQKKLAKAAQQSPYKEIRKAALKNLTDQSALAEVAKNDSETHIRVTAVNRLTDQAALTEIAKNDSESWVRREAAERLTDQAALTEIAKNDSESSVREAAVKNLTDDAVLADIAINDKNGSVSKAAVNGISDIGLLITRINDAPERLLNKNRENNFNDDWYIDAFDAMTQKDPDWFGKLTAGAAECILKQIQSCRTADKGRHVYKGSLGSVSDSIIRAYRDGLFKDIIQAHSGIVTRYYRHFDTTYPSCQGSGHDDEETPEQRLGDLL